MPDEPTLMWFGDGWDGPGARVDVPIGEICIHCEALLKWSDRGVVTPCSGRVWGAFKLDFGGELMRVCCYHRSCWLGLVVGGVLSHEVLARLPSERERVALQSDGVESVGDIGNWRDADGQENTDTVEGND